MDYLVIGANGYLGSRVAKYLSTKSNNVTALIHHKPDDIEKWESRMHKVICGDAADNKVVSEAFRDNLDCIIFTISLDHKLSGQDYFKTLKINVGIYWNLLERYASQQQCLVMYLSTQQVYGRFAGHNISESTPVSPVNAYGLTHAFCEELNSYYAMRRGISSVSLRISNSYGAPVFKDCNCWWLAINDICRMAVENKQIKLLSDGTPQRDFIYIDDVCRAIEKLSLVKSKAPQHLIYNLGSGKTYTILEAAHTISDIYKERFNYDVPVILPDGAISQGANKHKLSSRFTYDITKIREMDITPRQDIKDGVKEIISYLEK
jgi:nucleoside-diphosphate-sugar epimerase